MLQENFFFISFRFILSHLQFNNLGLNRRLSNSIRFITMCCFIFLFFYFFKGKKKNKSRLLNIQMSLGFNPLLLHVLNVFALIGKFC